MGRSSRGEEERLDASVSEIHRHPLSPPGYAEPLFLGRAAKKEIAEHLKESSGWLRKAGEACGGDLERAGEICHVIARPDGSAHLVRTGCNFAGPACRRRRRGTPGFAKRRVSRVIERWWEVRSWWEPGRETDRMCFRVLLVDGAVVDLALDRGGAGERAGSWSLVRVID